MQKLILFLCLGWAVSLHAQQFKVTFSPSAKVENDVTDFHRYGTHLYSDKTNWGNMQFALTASFKKVRYGIEINQYDENLKQVKTLSLDNSEKNFGPFRPLVHYGTSAIYVMYFRFMDDDRVKMYVAKVNPDDLSVANTQEVMTFDQKNGGFSEAMKSLDDNQTFYSVSPNGKNAWIVSASPKQIVSAVIDGDLTMMQKTETSIIKLESLLITGAYIDNDGNKVLAYRYDNPAIKEFYARGLFFQPANAKGTFADVKFPAGYAPGNLTLEPSKDGKKLYLGGEYFGDDYSDGGQGVLLAEVNIATKAVSKPDFYPYTDEIRQRVLDLRLATKKKGKIIFSDRHLNYGISEMENGTHVLSADMTATYKGPIIHVFITPSKAVTMALIPKSQTISPQSSIKGVIAQSTGFFTYVWKDKFICIYTDLPKFIETQVSDDDIARSPGGSYPVANVYDGEGKLLQRKLLIDPKTDLDGSVLINNASRNGDDKFIIPVGEAKVNLVKYYTRVNQICYIEIQ